MANDDSELLYWNEDHFDGVKAHIHMRLTELAQQESQPVFDQAVVPLLNNAAAASADLAALLTWRSGRPSKDPAKYGQYERQGDGSEEVENATDSLALFLTWVAWLIGENVGGPSAN